jgi:aromatic-amino-acid transaminase
VALSISLLLVTLHVAGERTGVVHIVSKTEAVSKAVLSQMKVIVRSAYSNPPMHGALIVSTILNTPELFEEWYTLSLANLIEISGRRS